MTRLKAKYNPTPTAQERKFHLYLMDAYRAASGQDVETLIDGFCKASPKAREIRDARNGA